MTLDSFKGVNLSPGQEIRSQDLNDAQRFLLSKLCDAMLEHLVPGADSNTQETLSKLDVTATHGTDVPLNAWAYALHGGQAYPRKGTGNDKIQVSAGTLFQKVAAHNGDEPGFLSYTFEGTEEVTMLAADASNPRVDLLQMKLEWVSGDSQSRVFRVEATPATLDLAAHTASVDTEVSSRVWGSTGNVIKLQFAPRASGVGVTVTETGFTVLVEYEDGVSTVADVEAAIDADSTLIEVTGNGLGAAVLSAPGDTFGPVNLAGGTNSVLTSQNFNMKRRVQMTLSMKQGVAGASPQYPTPDAGYVPIAAVLVPANWTYATEFKYADHATDAVLHDQRMPMGVPQWHTCRAVDLLANNSAGYWPLSDKKEYVTAGASKNNAFAVCPHARMGRLLAVQVTGCGLVGTHISHYNYNNLGTQATAMNDSNAEVNAVGAINTLTSERRYLESAHNAAAAGPTIQSSAASPYYGPPMWTSGRRVAVVENDFVEYDHHDRLCLLIVGATSLEGGQFIAAGFLVAEGL
jgi:hypothetical protein